MRRTVAGATLVETLVALLLGLLLLQSGLAAVARARSTHASAIERAEALSAARLVGGLMRAETTVGREGIDWVVDGDSLALRAHRGTGLICDEQVAPDAVVVSYVGYRQPDPTKDSVEVVYPDGTRWTAVLARVAAGPPTCRGAPLDGSLQLGLGEPAPAGGVLARVFERGSYHLSGGALRYRRGAGGRQPLTPELLEPASAWRRGAGGLSAELFWRPTSGLSPTEDDVATRAWRMPLGGGAR